MARTNMAAASRGKVMVALALKQQNMQLLLSNKRALIPEFNAQLKVSKWLHEQNFEQPSFVETDAAANSTAQDGDSFRGIQDKENDIQSQSSHSEEDCSYVPESVSQSDESDTDLSKIVPIGNYMINQTTEEERRILESEEQRGGSNPEKCTKPKRPCLYCGQFVSQLPRHLQRKHKNEDEVKAAMALPRTEKLRAFDKIRKEGIFSQNLKYRKEGKSLIRERKGVDCQIAMCNGCKGFFSKRRMSRHKQRCSMSTGLNTGSLDVRFLGDSPTDEFEAEVVQKFRNDDIGKICQSDQTVLRLGKKLWAKSARKEKRVIMNEMRTFGSLILETKKVLDCSIEGKDLLRKENFEALTKAIQNMSHKENGTLKAGLKLSIGYLLKKVIKIMKGTYIQIDNEEGLAEVDKFAALLDLNWDFIFYTAQLACEQRRQNLRKPSDMPLETDLSTFRSFIVNETARMSSDAFLKWDKHDFVFMRNLLVSRLTLFNARRGGEPARMLSDWKDAENDSWIDKQLVESVDDPLEKETLGTIKLAYQSGKGNKRLVPVLFPSDTIGPLKKLIAERSDCNINERNPFLFPNTGSSLDHVIGWNCIQQVAKLLGDQLKQPSLLIADKFRHRASTMFALLEVPQGKREIFYKHMGHTEGINRDVYQCPLAIREITDVGGFLSSLDKGAVKQRNTEPCDRDKEVSLPSEQLREPNPEEESSAPITVRPRSSNDEQCSDVLTEEEVVGPESTKTCEDAGKLREKTPSSTPSFQPICATKTRKYTRWTADDSDTVVSFFQSCIQTLSSSSSKGSLPGKKEIEGFLSIHSIFDDNISEKEKISLVKTKVFNERKKWRDLTKKSMESM